MDHQWNTKGTQMEDKWLDPLKAQSHSLMYFRLVYFLCTLRFCFGRGQLLAHSDILWFSTVVGRRRTSGIHHDARRGHHVRHDLDSAEKRASFLRDIGMDGTFAVFTDGDVAAAC